MNDDDYYLRGDPKEWKRAKTKQDPAVGLSHIEECKRLLAPYLQSEAEAELEACEHDYDLSDRLHAKQCKLCGHLAEYPQIEESYHDEPPPLDAY